MMVKILGEELELLPEKAIWWPSRSIILLADVHIGKVNHFRRAGIPIPTKANDKNWENMVSLIEHKKPSRIIFLGDLFHSHYNFEWESMGALVKNFPQVQFELVMGNHDILSDHQYVRSNITVYDELMEGPLLLTHHPLEEQRTGYYNLAGHIHPGIRLKGRARQSLVLPCFYFSEIQGYLPAFGAFTGLAPVKPKEGDRIFVVVENEIVKV